MNRPTRVKTLVPDHVDVHVGMRIKLRRREIGTSQEDLAGATGVTFQQVQKYESGYNRVSASRLFQIATALRVPMSYFFMELPATDGVAIEQDPMSASRAVELVTRFNRLDTPAQDHILGLLSTVHSRPNVAAAG